MTDMDEDGGHERVALAVAGLVQGQVLAMSALPVLIPRVEALHPRAREVLRATRGESSQVAAPMRIPSGLAMIVTQTCDLQLHRTRAGRVLSHVAPVVQLDGPIARDASRDTKPNYVPIPWLGNTYFADLDQIALIDRGLLARATPGAVPSGPQSRDLAYRLGRYFSRAAIPNNVVRVLQPLQVISKAKNNAVQRLLSSVTQVRVTSDPPFDQPPPYRLRITLLVDEDSYPDAAPAPYGRAEAELHRIAQPLVEMLDRAEDAEAGQVVTLWARVADHISARLTSSLVRGNGDVVGIDVWVATALTANEYANSDELDFGHLSLGDES